MTVKVKSLPQGVHDVTHFAQGYKLVCCHARAPPLVGWTFGQA